MPSRPPRPRPAQGREPPSAAAGGPLVGPGDRTLLSDRGAAALLGPDDLPDVAGFDHLHLSGYVLLDASSRAAGRAALAAARAAGISTSVDPQVAPALAAPGRAAAFLDDVQGVDLLLPNADELRALGGRRGVLRQVRGGRGQRGRGGRKLGGPDRRLRTPSRPPPPSWTRPARAMRSTQGCSWPGSAGRPRRRRWRRGARRARPRSAASAPAPDDRGRPAPGVRPGRRSSPGPARRTAPATAFVTPAASTAAAVTGPSRCSVAACRTRPCSAADTAVVSPHAGHRRPVIRRSGQVGAGSRGASRA